MIKILILILIIVLFVQIIKKQKIKSESEREEAYRNDYYHGRYPRKRGNSGVYAYTWYTSVHKSKGIEKYKYIIIDFDEEYLYLFGDEQCCEKIKLGKSESLKYGIVILDEWDHDVAEIRFRYKNDSRYLDVVDKRNLIGFLKYATTQYAPSRLEETLKLRDEYQIVESLYKSKGYEEDNAR